MILSTMVSGQRTEREFDLLRRSMAQHHPEIGWFVAGVKGSGADLEILPRGADKTKNYAEWSDFMTNKIELARHAIERFGYCAYVDADMVVLRPGMPRFPELLEECEVVLSPHYGNPWQENIYGKYNAGMFALRSLNLLGVWENLIGRKMWFTDQKPLEIACQGRKKIELGLEHDCGNWRYPLCRQTVDGIMVNGVKIVTYHGHLFDSVDPYDLGVVSKLVDRYPELRR